MVENLLRTPEWHWHMLSTTHLGTSRSSYTGWKTYGSLGARERVERCDSVWHLSPWGCDVWVGWMSQLSHRTPPAPGSPLAAFPHHCLLPQALSRSQRLCRGSSSSPWPSPSLEVVGPSTWRSPPVEGETTAHTWTTAGGEREKCSSFSLVGKNVWQSWNKLTSTVFCSLPLVQYIYWPQKDQGGNHTVSKRC